jgi:hypothetical protein
LSDIDKFKTDDSDAVTGIGTGYAIEIQLNIWEYGNICILPIFNPFKFGEVKKRSRITNFVMNQKWIEI